MRRHLWTVEERVLETLSKHPETRSNDMVLYGEYVRAFHKEAGLTTAYNAFIEADALGLPKYETVSRARRRLQAKYPELRPSKKVQRMRLDMEGEYIGWAIEP